MKVRDVMVKRVIATGKNATLDEVAALMLKNHIGCVPVVGEEGELIGMITETDLTPRLRNLPFSDFPMPNLYGYWIPMEGSEKVYKEVRNKKADEIMSPSVFTAKEEDSIDDVIAAMLQKRINHVPVLRGKKLVGIVTRHDMLRAFLAQTRRRKKIRIAAKA